MPDGMQQECCRVVNRTGFLWRKGPDTKPSAFGFRHRVCAPPGLPSPVRHRTMAFWPSRRTGPGTGWLKPCARRVGSPFLPGWLFANGTAPARLCISEAASHRWLAGH